MNHYRAGYSAIWQIGRCCELSALHAEPNVDATNVWARMRDRIAQAAGGLGRASQNRGRLAFGSDWRWLRSALGTACKRPDAPDSGRQAGGRVAPQERVSLEQAIEAYTLRAAYSGHRETSEDRWKKANWRT